MEKDFTSQQKAVLELIAGSQHYRTIPEALMNYFEKQYIGNPYFAEISAFMERINKDFIMYAMGDLDLEPEENIYKLRDEHAELVSHCIDLEEELESVKRENKMLYKFIKLYNLECPPEITVDKFFEAEFS